MDIIEGSKDKKGYIILKFDELKDSEKNQVLFSTETRVQMIRRRILDTERRIIDLELEYRRRIGRILKILGNYVHHEDNSYIDI